MQISTRDPISIGMPKLVFLARFEPVVTVLAPKKFSGGMKAGLFEPTLGPKGVKSDFVFKLILDPLRCSNKCFSPF